LDSFSRKIKFKWKNKFFENVHTKTEKKEKINFFHLGKANQWQNNLDKEISKHVEVKFFNEMKKLGYL
jgi:hypothetical protein